MSVVPSDRVQSGRFGACLMKEPALVANCISTMRSAVKIPITVKTRIGVDEQDSYAQLQQLLRKSQQQGVKFLLFMRVKLGYKG